MSNRGYHSQLIKALARKHGFDACGIAKAEKLEEEAGRLDKWLSQGLHGEMKYLENHFDMRTDPRLLVPGSRSVITFLYNYFPEQELKGAYKVAKYAYGDDYHDVVRDKLSLLFEDLKAEVGQVEGRFFVDSAPVLERAWAERSGLGWIGKHGLLINKKKGSYFFLAELICDLDCEEDNPVQDHCGTCNKCVEACPTEAILPNKVLNAKNCISYLTIELRGQIPQDFKGKMSDWIFGCDICQEVCPWNRFSRVNQERRFSPSENLKDLLSKDFENLNEDVFREVFRKSAVKRTKYQGLMRNLDFLKNH